MSSLTNYIQEFTAKKQLKKITKINIEWAIDQLTNGKNTVDNYKNILKWAITDAKEQINKNGKLCTKEDIRNNFLKCLKKMYKKYFGYQTEFNNSDFVKNKYEIIIGLIAVCKNIDKQFDNGFDKIKVNEEDKVNKGKEEKLNADIEDIKRKARINLRHVICKLLDKNYNGAIVCMCDDVTYPIKKLGEVNLSDLTDDVYSRYINDYILELIKYLSEKNKTDDVNKIVCDECRKYLNYIEVEPIKNGLLKALHKLNVDIENIKRVVRINLVRLFYKLYGQDCRGWAVCDKVMYPIKKLNKVKLSDLTDDIYSQYINDYILELIKYFSEKYRVYDINKIVYNECYKYFNYVEVEPIKNGLLKALNELCPQN